MKKAITQRKAKGLVRDYLRETGRKGVSSLMKDIRKFTGTAVFSQRTFEKWLTIQARTLNAENWEILIGFIESEKFRSYVPYANEGAAEIRLQQVGDGFAALYANTKSPKKIHMLPSNINARGIDAVQLLSGAWRHPEDLVPGPQAQCKVEPVPDKGYAKFAYISLNGTKYLSLTGLAIYIQSSEHDDLDYCHDFILQLWGRRDRNSGMPLTAQLTFLKQTQNQPEFGVSTQVEEYLQENEKLSSTNRFMTLIRAVAGPESEEGLIFDQLLEDVLPHGYSTTQI
ncbi:MAG: hypothetical protein DHS20C09_07610 [marine bacterium B5-7]|nr:MAG: hypothetical protein DHS20C09_07610 [marine bacterium B5-7]